MADREDGKDAVNYWPSVSDMFLVFFVLALCWGSTLVVKEQEGEIYAFEEVVYQANQLMSKLHNLEKKADKYKAYLREEEEDSYKNPRAEEITLSDGSKIRTQSRCPKLAARLMNVHDRILQLHLDSTNNKHTGNLKIPSTSIMLTSDAVEQQKKIRENTSSLGPMTEQEMLEETMQSTEYKELRARAGKNYIDAVRLVYMLVANKKEWERSSSMFSNRMLSEVNARLFDGTSLVQRLEGYEGVLDKFVGQEENPHELREKLDKLMAFYDKYKDVDKQLEELERLRKLLAGFGGKTEETAAILAELQKLRELLAGFAGKQAEKDKILADVKAWAAQLAKHPDLEKDLQLLDQLKSLLANAELENVSPDAEPVKRLESLLAKVKEQKKTIADKNAHIAALNEKVALLENQYVAAVELDGSELVFHVNTTEIDNRYDKSEKGLAKLETFCETLAQKLVSAESEGLVYVVEIIGHTDSDTSEFEFEPHGIGNVALGLARAGKIENEITRRVRELLGENRSTEILSNYLEFYCYSASSLYPHSAELEKNRRVELISRSKKKEQQEETKAQKTIPRELI